MKITFRKLENTDYDFKMLFKWCKNKYIYEWFEQRELSYDEITAKYQNELKNKKQDLFIIKIDNNEIGFLQIYKFEKDISIKEIINYQRIYEFDLFIGEESYLSKGIGQKIVKEVNNTIYSKYNAEAIILRPFKRNIRAIKCYEKSNYKIVKEYDGFDTLNNTEIIVVLLNKKANN